MHEIFKFSGHLIVTFCSPSRYFLIISKIHFDFTMYHDVSEGKEIDKSTYKNFRDVSNKVEKLTIVSDGQNGTLIYIYIYYIR